MIPLHIFVDESERGGSYLVGAVLVAPVDLADARSTMRGLRNNGKHRLHFNSEEDRHRKVVLTRLAEMQLRVRVYICREEPVAARAACLSQLMTDLAEIVQPVRLIIESRSRARDNQDKQTLFTSQQRAGKCPPALTYEHLLPGEDPMLWAADAALWAYGRDGDWRRRINPVIEKVATL